MFGSIIWKLDSQISDAERLHVVLREQLTSAGKGQPSSDMFDALTLCPLGLPSRITPRLANTESPSHMTPLYPP